MSLITKIFGDPNAREVKKTRLRVDRINTLEPELKKLSDKQLGQKTQQFKDKLAGKGNNKATLDDILEEAFGVVREASRRILKMRHFDVQLIGGIVLHQGAIAEMRTGEGKTLVATAPLYLNALDPTTVDTSFDIAPSPIKTQRLIETKIVPTVPFKSSTPLVGVPI